MEAVLIRVFQRNRTNKRCWFYPFITGLHNYEGCQVQICIMFQFKGHQAGKLPLTYERVSLFFYPVLPLIGLGPSTLEKTIWFTQSSNLNVCLIKKSIRTHPICKLNIWAPCGPVKLIHKSNCHRGQKWQMKINSHSQLAYISFRKS